MSEKTNMMCSFHTSVLFALVALSPFSAGKISKNEYCSLCQNHTMCQYDGVSKECENAGDGGVTEEEKAYIVDTHNWFRKVVSKGLETRTMGGALPKASNMRKMEWDEELQRVAQRWADQCSFQHDPCREDPRWKVGQNIYWYWRYPILNGANWTAALYSWFDEADKFHKDGIKQYEFQHETGHYSQLIWHDTHRIGCGRRTYGPNKLYVCNYGPAGNWLSEEIYNEGLTCSACPKDTVCNDGLCEELASPKTSETNAVDTRDSGEVLSLTPPLEDAHSIYDGTTDTSNDLSFDITQINDLDLPSDEDIRREIEELREKIRALVDKIAARKRRTNSALNLS